MGIGSCLGSEEGCGATLRSRGTGDEMAVPKGAKLAAVRGSGESVSVGFEVRVGAMMSWQRRENPGKLDGL